MTKLSLILKHVFGALAVSAVFGTAVMLLWNCLMPSIFGFSTINLWQALGLLVLSRMLFGGMVGRWMNFGGRWSHHNRRFRKKIMQMSNEERKAFFMKHKLSQCGFDCDFFQNNESGKNEGDEIKT
ncbi:MAG: hypothetical protein LBK94_09085 [Prevotellaceae bacterium]|jgi:hypothetical protein|nr:hypothetical protein [Prevotellaceae bacterium]